MGISRKIYSTFLSVKEFVSRKSFYNTLVVFFSLILFFGVMNVYAQEDLKVSPDWDGTKEFHNKISGTEADEDNMNSRQGLEVLNTGWTTLSILAPEITENSEDVLLDMNIPADLRGGVLGMVENAGNFVYASYPAVNIPQHLAQQWVPGYNESVTGLYAQNSSTGHPSGYEELMNSGIVSLWNRVLNLAYIAFVIVMIVAGFMIMFRHKLGGQTMVTIGNVLPRVVTSLILATFSFAIAGLIIDLGGVVTGLVSFILGENTDLTSISSFGSLFSMLFKGGNFGSFIVGAVSAIGIGALLKGGGLATIIGLTNPAALAVIGGGAVALGIIGVIIILIILGIVLFGAIKVLIALYKALFSLLLAIILGPVQIALGALPGNSRSIKNWFFSIVRNVLTFPAVFFVVNLPNALLAADSDVLLRFPGKLVYEDPSTYTADGVNVAGGLFIFILKIFVLFYAAQVPKFLEAIFPPDNNPVIGKGLEEAKKSLSGIPLVGSLFK